MRKDKGFWREEMSISKRIALFPVWLLANIYYVFILLCAALVPLGIAFELWDWFN